MPGVASGSASTSPAVAVLVVLRSPDPTGLRARLGVPATVDGDRLLVRVAADASDALLLAALQYGGFVESVGSG